MKEQFNLFLDSSQHFLNEIAISIPRILGAILILIIGWIIAKLIKRGIIKLLRLVKFNFLTEKTGIDKFLKEGGSKSDSIGIIGTLVYWILMLMVIIATMNSLNLAVASSLFNEIMLYLPNIIVAIVILIIGIYLARMFSNIIKTSLTGMKEVTAGLISRITYYAILILTIFVTLGQLRIANEIVTSAFIILFGAICLALALAFGLGGKDAASDILKELKKKEK
jgi:small-conductance mechanosensitive channel